MKNEIKFNLKKKLKNSSFKKQKLIKSKILSEHIFFRKFTLCNFSDCVKDTKIKVFIFLNEKHKIKIEKNCFENLVNLTFLTFMKTKK